MVISFDVPQPHDRLGVGAAQLDIGAPHDAEPSMPALVNGIGRQGRQALAQASKWLGWFFNRLRPGAAGRC
jgi:hypothetical protein